MRSISRRWKIISVIFITAFILMLWFGSALINNRRDNTNTTPIPAKTPSPSPIAKVVIDPGHGGYDAGASGKLTGTPESKINLTISQFVKEFLEKENVNVTLTRNNNEALASKKKDDMKIRRSIMHDTGADLTVSIHMNMFRDTSIYGPMVFYTIGDAPSKILADSILNSVCEKLDMRKRLTNPGDYYVIRNSSIPAVIIECGFLSNPEEEKKLCNNDYQKLMAKAISDGILIYINKYIVSSSDTIN